MSGPKVRDLCGYGKRRGARDGWANSEGTTLYVKCAGTARYWKSYSQDLFYPCGYLFARQSVQL